MIGQCSAPRSDLGLVRSLLDTVDCNIREGVQGGYNAFFGPGSTLTAVITILLTIYVALLGFRLLTGRTDLRVGDLPMIAIKLGAVVMLTTSWASYQSLVFALLFDGPAEIVNSLLTAMPMPQTVGPSDIFARLQYTFDQLTQSASAMALVSDDTGANPAAAGLQAGSVVLQAAPGVDPATLKGLSPIIQMRSALQGGPAFGATALWLSSIVLLVSTLGLLILAKLMLGLLLAIGPLFVGLLLFDATKGFFEGWLRTALGFALVPLATVVFMAALLASLEPSLQGLAVARAENRYAIEPILTVLVIVLTFTAVFGSVIGLCTRLVAGFRLADTKPRELEASVIGSEAGGRPTAFQLEQAGGNDRAARIAAQVGQDRDRQGSGGDRRDARLAAAVMVSGGASVGASTGSSTTTLDRRTEVSSGGSGFGERRGSDSSARLGQTGRRRSNPTLSDRTPASNNNSQVNAFVPKKLTTANGTPR